MEYFIFKKFHRTGFSYVCLTLYFLLSYLLLSIANLHATDKNTLDFCTIDVSPYGIRGDSKQCGIYFDLVNISIRRSGVTASNSIIAYPRIIRELKNGKPMCSYYLGIKNEKDFPNS